MKRGSLSIMKQKEKTTSANSMSEGMQEPMQGLKNDVKIVGEGHLEKDPTKGSSPCYVEENTSMQNQPFHVALVNSGGEDATGSESVSIPKAPPNVEKDGVTLREKRSSYPCKYCQHRFATAQALGGHQNTHRYVREKAKKQRVQGDILSSSSQAQPCVHYPNYGGSPNTLSLGHPKLPLYNSNFTLPKPLFQYSQSIPGFLATPYPQSTTRTALTLGQPSQLFNTFINNRQLSVFTRSMMIRPNIVNNVNYNGGNFNFRRSMVGGEGGILKHFGAPNANINSMGIVGVRGRDYTYPHSLTLGGNSYFPLVGIEGTCTNRGVFRNFLEVSQGESSVRGYDENDGTIDLLSRVGMCARENEKRNDKDGNGANES